MNNMNKEEKIKQLIEKLEQLKAYKEFNIEFYHDAIKLFGKDNPLVHQDDIRKELEELKLSWVASEILFKIIWQIHHMSKSVEKINDMETLIGNLRADEYYDDIMRDVNYLIFELKRILK